jgi:hypothetical protein
MGRRELVQSFDEVSGAHVRLRKVIIALRLLHQADVRRHDDGQFPLAAGD